MPKLPPYHQHHQDEKIYIVRPNEITIGKVHLLLAFNILYNPKKEIIKMGVYNNQPFL